MPTASQKPKGYGIGMKHQEADLAAGSGGACPENHPWGRRETPRPRPAVAEAAAPQRRLSPRSAATATKPKPVEDGGARLLDGDGRVTAQTQPSVVATAESDVSEVVACQVSVRDLKTHLSEWLGRVQAGEEVEVTSHRKPIARITAVKPAAPSPTSPLQEAIDAGLISWNGQNPVIPPPVKLNDGGPLMSDIVIEDRG
jgi:prevent-host-death family protein